MAYEAELALDVGEEEIVRSDEEENLGGLDVEAEQGKRGDDGYGRKKHPSVRGRLGCDTSNLDNVDEEEEGRNKAHVK